MTYLGPLVLALGLQVGAVAPVSPPAIAGVAQLPAGASGPAAPLAPDVIARDAVGRATIRAQRLDMPLVIDGRLDESLYERTPPISDLVQTEPQAGRPATQRTEAWLFFDQDAVYVAFRCWESNPERMVLNEMRRDNLTNIANNERISWVFDTFFDRRNGVMFTVTPIGARIDAQLTDRQTNVDWNPVWDFATSRFDGGWMVEAAIPFKSLRYRPGQAQVWGFQIQRMNRWKNEVSTLVPVPNALGVGGLFQTSLAATVVGLEAPSGSRTLEVKPYVVSALASALRATPRVANDFTAAVGGDVKYGVTQNLTADLTFNTDFAQVEADEQQINLTRFSLFFPEKREFFLENQGLFAFGGVPLTSAAGDLPILFYSRRIGLDPVGGVVPIDAGGRLTGRVGRLSVGALSVQSDDVPGAAFRATNFSAVRIKRDFLRRSGIGVVLTNRSVGQAGRGQNLVGGVDGTFRFFNNLNVNTFWARTDTTGVSGDDVSYRGQVDYGGDRYGLQLEQLAVGKHFNPEMGFVRRPDIRRSFAQARFSPRPRANRSIRKFSWTGSFAYVENGAGRVESRNTVGEFAIDFQNSDRLAVTYAANDEFLPRPFRIAPTVSLPVGSYDFRGLRVAFTLGQQRTVSANVAVEHGTFYNGHRTMAEFTRSRVKLTPRLSVEPSYTVNWVDLVEGSFTTTLAGGRVVYGVTPMMFASELVQYNSSSRSMSANVRLRWEYSPGSELFVVYNEDRDTLAPRYPELTTRAVIVKLTRLIGL